MDGFFGGASQFAGGGFMPSPAPGNENQYGAGGEGRFKKTGGRGMETIRAVTVRQLLRDTRGEDDGDATLDGAPVTSITIVGRILDVSETATKVAYTVHDGSGALELQMHAQEDDEVFQARKRELVPGVYVRAYGVMRCVAGRVSMTAYHMKPLQDFNEVSYHSLQVIFQHLHILKGAPPPAGALPLGPAGGLPGQQQQQAYGGPVPGGAPVGGSRTGDPTSDVLEVFRAPQNRHMQHGLNAAQVDAQLKAKGIHLTLQQIHAAIEFNANEGHLYSTMDDCFKCADM